MDSTPNQTAADDFSSQLVLNAISTDGGGPINFLTNEIMALFFDKLKLKLCGYNDDNIDDNEDDEDDDDEDDEDEVAYDGDNEDDEDNGKDEGDDDEDGGNYYYDAKMLAKLRLVSKRWNLLVEDFCRQKKSLNVNGISFYNADLKNSAPLIVKLITIDFFGTMLNLFPNLVQLAVGFWTWGKFDDTQIRNFAAQIDSLSSLKRLNLEGQTLAAIPHLSHTLSNLELLEVDASQSSYGIPDDLLEFVFDLGPDCSVGLYLGEDFKVVYDDILQCHNKNPHFYANLTHLRMFFRGDPEVCAKVVHFLSEQATSLQVLAIYALDLHLEMSPSVIRDLAKLVHLTKLNLWRILIDIPELEIVQDGLTSLPAVLTCELYVYDGRLKNAYKFTRVLSTIFPNLVDLHLEFNEKFSWPLIRKIEQKLNRFPNLRKHKVEFL